MKDASLVSADLQVRELQEEDLADVVRIDTEHTGERKPDWWRGIFRDFLGSDSRCRRVGLAAERDGRLLGYLLGEVRAFEFGSEACGWVFSVGVDPDHTRGKVASLLLAACCQRFRDAGVTRVRTMVRRKNVPFLAFFRANGFVAGSFVQLELDLEESE